MLHFFSSATLVSSVSNKYFLSILNIIHTVYVCGAWWLIGRFGIFCQKSSRLESCSGCSVDLTWCYRNSLNEWMNELLYLCNYICIWIYWCPGFYTCCCCTLLVAVVYLDFVHVFHLCLSRSPAICHVKKSLFINWFSTIHDIFISCRWFYAGRGSTVDFNS